MKIHFTTAAIQELELILKNDFTLKSKYFRILISGKGCDGFTYSCGFTDWNEQNDILVPADGGFSEEFLVALDSFAAFYLQNVEVDFVADYMNNREGFTIRNLDQEKYKDKFWLKDPTLVPPDTKSL